MQRNLRLAAMSMAILTAVFGTRIAMAEEDEPKRRSAIAIPATKIEAAKKAPSKAKSSKAKPPARRTITRPKPVDIDEKSTHQQSKIIKVVDSSGKPAKVNTFCMGDDGHILVGAGIGPGTIHVLEADGKVVRSWKVPIKPESIGIAPDGSVLVAGRGKLFKFDDTGKLLQQAEAPHARVVKENAKRIREQVIKQATQRSQMYERQVALYEKQIKLLTDKGVDKLTEVEKARLQAFQRAMKMMQQFVDKAKAEPIKLDEEKIEQQVERRIQSKMRIASISATSKDVFVSCPSTVGYTFDVWRMNHQLKDAEQIITGLRGCCGQMDVQASGKGIYVAENSRHRVCRYDRQGELVHTWGKRDRKGVDGFTSCCNPMNVCFGANGDVYTAESNSGRIRRFSFEGAFLDFVGDVKLVPGCKNVSIARNPKSGHVYMLDITRNHIVALAPKPPEKSAAKVAP